ncbi:MAG: hypothetical protein KDE01_24965, partial [Caldilineaceae bacterium]|nr:hypothetical protein [Caldilineaceae bacterium]
QRNAVQNEPLWVYDAAGRTWLLNLAYTRRGAMTYLRTLPVTLAEWRQAWDVTRSQWSRQHLSGE